MVCIVSRLGEKKGGDGLFKSKRMQGVMHSYHKSMKSKPSVCWYIFSMVYTMSWCFFKSLEFVIFVYWKQVFVFAFRMLLAS